MKTSNSSLRRLGLALFLGLAAPSAVHAQFFSYNPIGDIVAGFRKSNAGTYELVVNLGSVTNFLALGPGAVKNITTFSPSQLSDAFADGYQNLQWSVFGTVANGSVPWTNGLGIFPPVTSWYTSPRADPNTPTATPNRLSLSSSTSLSALMKGVAGSSGATFVSTYLAVTNADNNTVLVREPISSSTSANILTAYIGDISDPSIGDFGGNVLPSTVENVTPDPFSSATVSDFYESAPASSGHNKFIDPYTGLTNGPDYFVGYFTLNPDGTMSFTRAGGVVVPPPPPPPQIVGVTRGAGSSTIFFTTTNSATYTLYFTNSAGLTAPLANWAASPTTVTGNGLTNSLSDPAPTTDANRFYRVGAH